MRIAFCLGSLNPGGDEIQMTEVAAQLKQRGYDVHLVLPHGAGHIPGNRRAFCERAGLPMLDLAAHEDKRAALAWALGELQPEVMITNGYPITLWAALAAQQVGVPERIIKVGHCGFVREQFAQPEQDIRAGYQAATHIVCNSEAVRASMAEVPGVDLSRCVVLYNGLDVGTRGKREKARQRWGVGPDQVVIGYLANFRQDRIKNQALLVKAMQIVSLACPQAVAMMCGYATPYQDEVEALARELDVMPYVRFPGRINDLDELAGWDIAVNVSHTEGFSNAIQQCMSYGLPMVATAVGGTVEQIEDGLTGYLIADDDLHALSLRLIGLCRDARQRQRMGQAARGTAQRWGWDRIMQQWERVIHAHIRELAE